MKSVRLLPITPALSLVGVLALGLGMTGRAGAQTALPKSSPFMSSVAAPDPASAPGETIEFAAVRTIGKRTEIDLYDTHGKKNHWIPVGGTVEGMTIVGYDATRDQVTAKIGGVNKVLRLRQTKGIAAGTAAVTAAPAMSFATPTAPPPAPTFTPPPQSAASTPAVNSSGSSTPVANPTPATPETTKPAVPLSIARQEEEARMLVSDLLEIGMAQRKAYEEKQKQAADPNAAAAAAAATAATPAPAPAQPNPGGPPSGE